MPLTAKRESVWDYPRPPKVETVTERISVRFADEVIADTTVGRRDRVGIGARGSGPSEKRREYRDP